MSKRFNTPASNLLDDYRPFWPFTNGTFNTLVSNLRRQLLPAPSYQRVNVPTRDGDMLALDMVSRQSPKAVLLVHGLEGNSHSAYIKGMDRCIQQLGLDTLCLNLRGCGGGLPHKPVTYHSGKTDDLETVVNYIRHQFSYQSIGLIGFSLGGNLVLKYAGEQQNQLPTFIKFLTGIAVPYDLKQVVRQLDRNANWLFRYHFLRTLKERAIKMKQRFPQLPVKEQALKATKTLEGFDEVFTAPVHGFRDAIDYYSKCSCAPYLPAIERPTSLLSAKDDPFIPQHSIPKSIFQSNPFLSFQALKYGGHLGFGHFKMPRLLWHEQYCKELIKQYLN